MKKTIWIFLFLLVFGALSMVNAQETPTISLYDNTTVTAGIVGRCDSDGVDTILCAYGIGTDDEYIIYNINTMTVTLVDITNNSYWLVFSDSWSDLATCHYYSGNDKFYCIVPQSGGGIDEFGVLEITPPSTVVKKTSHPESVTGATMPRTSSCDLRPGTDEIYCWTNFATTTPYNNFWKYDIGDDAWTILKNEPFFFDNAHASGCVFRDSTDLWCYGGQAGVHTHTNFTIYDVVANTTTIIQNNEFQFSAAQYSPVYCRWYLDILYCYGGINGTSGVAMPDLYYYDAVSGTKGYIKDVMPEQYVGGLAQFDATTDYMIWGLDSTYTVLYTEIWEIEWSEIAEEEAEAPVVSEENIGGNIIALQNLRRSQRQAQLPVEELNFIEQLILRLRAFILGIFGHEV